MLMYFLLFSLGTITVICTIYIWIRQSKNRATLFHLKSIVALTLGLIMLWMTVPSLKDVVMKDFEIVTGACTIDIASSGRSAHAVFHLTELNETFTYDTLPTLSAYGKAVPYYCEMALTKDRSWTMHYDIYDVQTHELITSSRH